MSRFAGLPAILLSSKNTIAFYTCPWENWQDIFIFF
jgi:hypothetical protein